MGEEGTLRTNILMPLGSRKIVLGRNGQLLQCL
jgi:hypothetical protein